MNNIEEALINKASQLLCQEIDKAIIEWMTNPEERSKKELKEVEERYQQSIREAKQYGYGENIGGDLKCITYGEYVSKMKERYNHALNSYRRYNK